jgi:hypothetical protein
VLHTILYGKVFQLLLWVLSNKIVMVLLLLKFLNLLVQVSPVSCKVGMDLVKELKNQLLGPLMKKVVGKFHPVKDGKLEELSLYNNNGLMFSFLLVTLTPLTLLLFLLKLLTMEKTLIIL